ncbi:Rid family hydrolase [Pseudomonas putida]
MGRQVQVDTLSQTIETLAYIDLLLEDVGSHKSKFLKVTTYLKDIITDFATMSEVWVEWVAEGQAPARACVEGSLDKYLSHALKGLI